jgi:hypothetical protein
MTASETESTTVNNITPSRFIEFTSFERPSEILRSDRICATTAHGCANAPIALQNTQKNRVRQKPLLRCLRKSFHDNLSSWTFCSAKNICFWHEIKKQSTDCLRCASFRSASRGWHKLELRGVRVIPVQRHHRQEHFYPSAEAQVLHVAPAQTALHGLPTASTSGCESSASACVPQDMGHPSALRLCPQGRAHK